LLTNALVLNIEYLDKECVVCIDAYKRGLIGALMQEGHVVCYESRKLNENKHNYVTHDLELATIILALKMWRHYLLSRRFLLMSDHCGLRYLFEKLNMNFKKVRWLAMISEFELEIRYIKGKENKIADVVGSKSADESYNIYEFLWDRST